MYDSVKVPINILPITETMKHSLGEDHLFQSKDFDCILALIELTEEGELFINRFERGWDDSKINAFGTRGIFTRENERREKIELNGIFNFYTFTDDNFWLEFNAEFIDGKLTEITLVEEKYL